jgi:hypothetical protein
MGLSRYNMGHGYFCHCESQTKYNNMEKAAYEYKTYFKGPSHRIGMVKQDCNKKIILEFFMGLLSS